MNSRKLTESWKDIRLARKMISLSLLINKVPLTPYGVAKIIYGEYSAPGYAHVVCAHFERFEKEGIIEKETGKPSYRATEKGKKFLEGKKEFFSSL